MGHFHVRLRAACHGRRQIHNAARGYPRAVNNLAVHALTTAFAARAAIVDEKAARIAVTETGHD